MLFNSLRYLIFFPIVVLTYFALPARRRWVLLLIASYYFYMCWRIEYTLMLVFITVVDYFAALEIVRHPHGSFRRKLPLVASLIGNLGLLFAFKYWNFFGETVRDVAANFHVFYRLPHLDMLLPVGISFHTFQSVSYNIDVYRGKIPPERHFGIFTLFVAYFPQLVAGPIERGAHILPQFHAEHDFDYGRVVRGLQLAAWGMFKKVVIADRLAVVANSVYNDLASHTPAHLAIATVFFAFQIYCDFSGYSDIAIGSAEVLGVQLVRNFNRPYFAASIGEFWRRWHISLSTWFRDYVFIPLGGSRVRVPRWYLNLMFTFVVSGLWHGAKWTFVLWGALNGFYLVAELALSRPAAALARALRLDRVPMLQRALQISWTFSLTCFAWVFFRANSLADAQYVATRLPSGLLSLVVTAVRLDTVGLYQMVRGVGLQLNDFMLAVGSIGVLLFAEALASRYDLRTLIASRPALTRWAFYYAGTASLLLFGAFNSSQTFIYFQF
jgi:D-alanyl-lipoteichoic acid acyltransferase DltB (MBOAT superfamily)